MKKNHQKTLALVGLNGLLLAGNASAVVLSIAESGTAFEVGTASFYNENANLVGGSSNATIPEFINLYFFDASTLAANEEVTGGTLSFTVSDGVAGTYSGTLQVEFVGSLATIPVQNGANNSASDQVLVGLATQSGATEVFNGAVAQGDSDSAALTGLVNNDNDFLVFRFSDVSPAANVNQQSNITGVSLDVTTQVIPEPSAALLSGLAVLGFLVRRRR